MRFAMASLGTLLSLGALPVSGRAEIVDRIAVIVDNQAIKQSDILNEIRVTDFLNGAKLDLSLAAQKQAASRLIDQKVIRKAMETGLYPAPAPEDADRLLRQVRQRFPNDAAYRRELANYGLTEDLLKEHLLWQLAVLQFISLRFQTAGADSNDASNSGATNQQFFDWLDQSRKEIRIEFKQGDLQ